MKKTVLIVDDSVYMRMLIRQALEKVGYQIIAEAANGETAIELAIEHEPDLITLDNVMPDMFGAEVLKTLKAEGVTSEVIVISAVGQKTVIEKEKALGIAEFIVKPFTEEQLIDVVTNVMQTKAA
ncbi:MAG: response regulator [Rickettsiales bacterium]|nr:response regulator [Rickettsiales bacterium]